MQNLESLLLAYVKRNITRSFCYAAFLTCGITAAIFEIQALFAETGDALIGPYFVTLLILLVAAPIGILTALFQKSLFLFVLAILTGTLLAVSLVRPQDNIWLNIFEALYPLVTIIGTMISWYGHYRAYVAKQ